MTLPTFISFDCYGTLIHFQMRETVAPLVAERLGPARFESFLALFRAYRYDQIMEYAPYDEVLEAAFRRTCRRFGLAATADEVAAITAAVTTWGPHPDVPGPLATLAEHFPLVILSNADDRHLAASVPRLGAPFHAVISAEQAGAYKPRFQAFEYMFEALSAGPGDFLHVSSHLRYDLLPAADLGITDRVYLDRGYDPQLMCEGNLRITSLGELITALGIG